MIEMVPELSLNEGGAFARCVIRQDGELIWASHWYDFWECESELREVVGDACEVYGIHDADLSGRIEEWYGYVDAF